MTFQVKTSLVVLKQKHKQQLKLLENSMSLLIDCLNEMFSKIVIRCTEYTEYCLKLVLDIKASFELHKIYLEQFEPSEVLIAHLSLV